MILCNYYYYYYYSHSRDRMPSREEEPTRRGPATREKPAGTIVNLGKHINGHRAKENGLTWVKRDDIPANLIYS